MTTKEVNNLIKKLYDQVQKSGWSSHLYRDEDWHNLYEIRNICNQVLPDGYKMICAEIYGYKYNNQCKQYLFAVENELTGERIIGANVNAHSAGTVENIWSAYDTTCTFFKWEN